MNRNNLFIISFFSFTSRDVCLSHPPYKAETSNFRGKNPIKFLISITLSLKSALDESSLKKIMFLCIMGFFRFSGNFDLKKSPQFILINVMSNKEEKCVLFYENNVIL